MDTIINNAQGISIIPSKIENEALYCKRTFYYNYDCVYRNNSHRFLFFMVFIVYPSISNIVRFYKECFTLTYYTA